jgi:hypothetical protein
MADHFSTYLYQKRGFFYFSKRVPKELQQCHSKQRIVLALNTRSRAKALKYSQVICQRLDERWLPIRLDALGLGNVMALTMRLQIYQNNDKCLPTAKALRQAQCLHWP